MEEYKTKIIIAGSISLVLIILIIILSIIRSNFTTNEAIKLTDQKTFLTINELLNEITNDESYMSSTYLPEEIYYKDFDLITIYFVKGSFITRDIESEYKDNENYLIKVNGINYEISALSNITNIKEYADNYNEDNISVHADDILPSIDYDEEDILRYYIFLFINLYDVNPDKAYNYLSDNMKNKYSLNSFKNENILSQINTNIKSHTKKGSSKKTIYTINTNGKTITIVEKSLLDFTIEF